MFVPLLLGALLRTFWPRLFADDNAVFRTSFTGGLFTGAIPFLAAFYVCLGSTIDLRQTGYIVKKGVALWLGKIGTAAVIGLFIRGPPGRIKMTSSWGSPRWRSLRRSPTPTAACTWH